ncbi:MAG: hypothetical protein RR626_04485 [Anaerovoracaceae bacterium]
MEFTYREYTRLIEALKEEGYVFTDYFNEKVHPKAVILRHDVDASLEKAVAFARIEHQEGVKATYFILLSTDFYNVSSKGSAALIQEICDLGHDIGLHYDEKKYIKEGQAWDEQVVRESIQREAAILSSIIGVAVRSVSMHVPSKETLQANLAIEGLVNSYSDYFFNGYKYISDSFRNWREDAYEVISSKQHKKIHLLTHPFWYNEEDFSRAEVFRNNIDVAAKEKYRQLEENLLPPGSKLKDYL